MTRRSSSSPCRPRSRLLVAIIVVIWFFWSCHFYLMIHLSSDIDIDGKFPNLFPIPNQRVDSKQNGIATNHRHNVHLVVSHCDKPIGWIWNHFDEAQTNEKHKKNHQGEQYDLKSVTVISKCNVTIPEEDLKGGSSDNYSSSKNTQPPLIQVVSLPNVGRCDHSYAYWIKEMLQGMKDVGGDKGASIKRQPTKPIHELLYSNHDDGSFDHKSSPTDDPFRRIVVDPKDLVLFLKDNDNSYRGADIDDSIRLPNVLDLLTLENRIATTYSDLKSSGFERSISRGMACQSYPNSNHFKTKKLKKQHRMTNLAHRSVQWTFNLESYVRAGRDNVQGFQSSHRPMGAWIKHLEESTRSKVFSKEYYEQMVKGVVDSQNGFYYNTTHKGLSVVLDYPKRGATRNVEDYRQKYNTRHYTETDLVPVCYGGVFATHWGQLASTDAPLTPLGWKAVTLALSRADNLEEGHYMERWWGDLLSWSHYADRPFMQQQHTTAASTHLLRGVTLPEDEIALLLQDKLRHMPTLNPYAGMVILDGDKLEREGIPLRFQEIVVKTTKEPQTSDPTEKE